MFKKIFNYLINSKGMSELYVWSMCEKYEKRIFSIISLVLSIVLALIVGIIVYCYIPDIEIVGKFLIAFYILILFYFFLSYIVDYSALYVWEKYYDEKGDLKTHYVRKSNPTQGDYLKAYIKGKIVGALIYIIPLLPIILYVYLNSLGTEEFPFPAFYLISLVLYYGVIFKLRKEIPPYTEWFLQYAHNNFDELLSLDCYWGLSDADIKIQKENIKRYSSFQNISILTRLMAPFFGLICIVFSLLFVPLMNETSSEVNNEVELVEDTDKDFPSESVNISDVQDPIVETNETTIIVDEEVVASVESEDVQEIVETESYGDVGDTELVEDEIDIIEIIPEDNTIYSNSDLDERAVFSCGNGSIVALNSYVEAKIAENEKIMNLCRSKSRNRIQMQFVLYKDRSIEILDLVSELSSIEDDLKEIIKSAGVESVALKDGKDVNSKCSLILDIDIY